MISQSVESAWFGANVYCATTRESHRRYMDILLCIFPGPYLHEVSYCFRVTWDARCTAVPDQP